MKPKPWLRYVAAATSLLLFSLGLQAQSTCPSDRTLAGTAGSTININTGLDVNLNLLPFAVPDPRWLVANNTLPHWWRPIAGIFLQEVPYGSPKSLIQLTIRSDSPFAQPLAEITSSILE